MYIANSEAIAFLVCTTFIFSSYLSLRKKFAPNVNGCLYSGLFLIGQFTFALVWWLVAGETTVSFNSAAMEKTGFAILSGGMVIIAEFLFFSAVPHLRYSVFIGIACASYYISTPWTYFIDSIGISAAYLFGSLGFMSCGLASLIYSQYLVEESRQYQPIASSETPHYEVEDADEQLTQSPVSIWYWIVVALVGAFFMAMWAIMSAYAYTGADALSDPALMFLLMECGCVVVFMFVIFVSNRCIHLGGVQGPGFSEIGGLLMALPLDQVLYSLLIAMYSATAYLFYYYGVMYSSVPTAVAVEFLMCQAPMAIVISVLASDEKNTDWHPLGMVFVAFLFYASAAVLLFLYTY